MKGRIMSIEKILNFAQHNPKQFILILLIGFFFLWSQFTRDKAMHQRNNSGQQKKAQNPSIPKQFIRRGKPDGVVLGSAGKDYFCVPEEHDLVNVLILGGSGSGKSSGPIISTLLSNYADEKDGRPSFRTLAIDLKGELHKSIPTSQSSSSYYLIDPTDRDHSVGWDPFFLLNREENPDSDLMIRVFSSIASSFIPSGGSDQAFFSENATSLLSGFLSWGFEHDIGMVDMVQKILTSNITELLKKCLKESDEDSVSYSWLSKFQGTETSEAFQNFTSEMTTNLSCFKLNSVQYVLRDNPDKIGPADVREKDVFLSVPDNLLTQQTFAPVFRMILEQEMQYLTEKLPEKGTKPVCLLIDELYAVGGGPKGKLEGLETYLAICRGYSSFCILSTQGLGQLQQQYQKEGARIILDNCRCKVYLEASDIETINGAVEMCGKYYERELSISNTDRMQSSVSWHEKDIFDRSYFLNLAANGRVIVILQSGKNSFYNIKKLQWFRDKYLSRIHDTNPDKTE